MELQSYFDFLEKVVPSKLVNSKRYWYAFDDIYAMCRCKSYRGTDQMNEGYDILKRDLYHIFGSDYIEDDVIPGMMFQSTTFISELLVYGISSRSCNAFSKLVMLWISDKTHRKFNFANAHPKIIDIINNMYSVRVINLNGMYYFNLNDIANILKVNIRGVVNRIKNVEDELIKFILDKKSIHELYEESFIIKNYLLSRRKISELLYNISLIPDNKLEIDDLSRRVISAKSIIQLDNIPYITLPALYRYLSTSKSSNAIMMMKWFYESQIPGIRVMNKPRQ